MRRSRAKLMSSLLQRRLIPGKQNVKQTIQWMRVNLQNATATAAFIRRTCPAAHCARHTREPFADSIDRRRRVRQHMKLAWWQLGQGLADTHPWVQQSVRDASVHLLWGSRLAKPRNSSVVDV